MKKSMIKMVAVVVGLVFMVTALAGCGDSEVKKEMDSAISAANELVEAGEEAYDPATLEALEAVIASAEEAEDDAGYQEVIDNLATATAEYEKSVKQMQQVTNPAENFLLDRVKDVESITDVEAATEETDANKLMNKPGGYTSYIAMKSSLVDDEYGLYKDQSPVEAGTDGGAVIEAFPTKEDAEAREEYLASFDGSGMLSSGSHKVVGTLLIRTSNELTASEQADLEQAIIDALIRIDE